MVTWVIALARDHIQQRQRIWPLDLVRFQSAKTWKRANQVELLRTKAIERRIRRDLEGEKAETLCLNNS